MKTKEEKKNCCKKEEKREEPRQPKASKTDPLGSYTGVPADIKDTPVQDADDL